MLDKSIPRFLIALEKKDAKNYPRYELPGGYTVRMYEPDMGYEDAYARMELASGQFSNLSTARETFTREFLSDTELDPRERCVFVISPEGEAVATCSMWKGIDLSVSRRPRIHWLIVDSKHEGKGIARALITKMLDLNASLDNSDYVYLNTGTWNYHAINIYLDFGFIPYYEKKPLRHFDKMTEEEWAARNQEAWNTVMDKIKSYKDSKR